MSITAASSHRCPKAKSRETPKHNQYERHPGIQQATPLSTNGYITKSHRETGIHLYKPQYTTLTYKYSKNYNTKMPSKWPTAPIPRLHIRIYVVHGAGYLYYKQRKDPRRNRIHTRSCQLPKLIPRSIPDGAKITIRYTSSVYPGNDINGNLDNQSLLLPRAESLIDQDEGTRDDMGCMNLLEKAKTVITTNNGRANCRSSDDPGPRTYGSSRSRRAIDQCLPVSTLIDYFKCIPYQVLLASTHFTYTIFYQPLMYMRVVINKDENRITLPIQENQSIDAWKRCQRLNSTQCTFL